MKKIIIILNFLVLTLFISGCGCSKKEEEKIVVCTLKEEYEKYNLDSTIKIKYESVTNKMILFEESSTLISDDPTIREYFKTTNDNDYSNYRDYYDSFIEDDKATMSIKIDFKNITVDEFLKLDDLNSSYLTDNKIDSNKIIEYYKEFTNYECN